jgi:hypothetical protein
MDDLRSILAVLLVAVSVGFIGMLYALALLSESKDELRQIRLTLEKMLRHSEQTHPVDLRTQAVNRIMDGA